MVKDLIDGNSILIQEDDHLSYVFIGSSIYRFQALDIITNFCSPVGNNGVHYPFAIDSSERFYFLLERNVVEQVPEVYRQDAYPYFYKLACICDWRLEESNSRIIQNFRGIRNFRISVDDRNDEGEDQKGVMPWRYYSSLNATDQQLIDLNLVKLQIQLCDDDMWHIITKDHYMEIRESFGQLIGTRELPHLCQLASTYEFSEFFN